MLQSRKRRLSAPMTVKSTPKLTRRPSAHKSRGLQAPISRLVADVSARLVRLVVDFTVRRPNQPAKRCLIIIHTNASDRGIYRQASQTPISWQSGV
jgi:hypothetical protein